MLQKDSIPIEISARHVHLSEEDFKTLFSGEAKLTFGKKLSQAGEFASEFQVTLKNEERLIGNVRVLGPYRSKTQVEVSRTDARYLKADVPLRLSGDLTGSAPIKLISSTGAELELGEGMIVAKRHLHISTTEAEKIGVRDGQEISVRVSGDRGGQLDHCVVRVRDSFNASFHLDTDEANALGIGRETYGELIESK